MNLLPVSLLATVAMVVQCEAKYSIEACPSAKVFVCKKVCRKYGDSYNSCSWFKRQSVSKIYCKCDSCTVRLRTVNGKLPDGVGSGYYGKGSGYYGKSSGSGSGYYGSGSGYYGKGSGSRSFVSSDLNEEDMMKLAKDEFDVERDEANFDGDAVARDEARLLRDGDELFKD